MGYLLSTYTTIWVLWLLPERLATSLLIFFVFGYVRYQQTQKLSWLFWASFYLAWLTALKPYFALLYLVIGLGFIWQTSLGLAGSYTKNNADSACTADTPYTLGVA